ncbi:MAG: Lrp/AsnC family transcriptional regulator [Candidatus Heimdallarchaeota archaeon]|nr:Lrp/AsnC family transcriptional regulator [Candidatus Heimdallarchaeota archaeon]
MDKIDEKIFNLLYQDPFRSINEISKVLGVSFTLVNSRINKMKQNGLLYKNKEIIDPIFGKRTTSHITASVNSNALGLIKHHIIFYNLPNIETIQILDKFFDVHPYTTYKATVIGQGMSMYAQFDFHPSIMEDMIELYELICQELNIPDYLMIKGTDLINIQPNLSYQHLEDENINVEDNFNKISNKIMSFYWKKYLKDKEMGNIIKKVIKIKPVPKVKISELQLKLIREITINGNAPLKELSKYYKRDVSTISRYLNGIKEKYIRNGKLKFHPSNARFNCFKFITGEFSFRNGITKNDFKEFISYQEFPFFGFIVFENNYYLMYVATNTKDFQEIYEFIWNNSVSNTIQVFELYTENASEYFFYHLNFINGKFNTDKKYFFDDPLKELEIMIKTTIMSEVVS